MDEKEKLVLRINELHHNLEEKRYGQDNEYMFKSERERWKKTFNKYFKKRMQIMELGVGTGFVPQTFLKTEASKFKSAYVCTDISKGILDRCRKALGKQYGFKYKKISSKKLPFPNNSFDAIIMNSVLHHLPDVDFFFKEARRTLKKGGLLVIGHEPNKKFHKHLLTKGIFNIISWSAKVFGKIKNLGKENPHKEDNKIINRQLIKEKLIEEPLSDSEISRLIDYRAATGFDIEKLGKQYGFKILSLETYNYLLSLSFNYPNFIFKQYEKALGKILKERGGTFFAILKKA